MRWVTPDVLTMRRRPSVSAALELLSFVTGSPVLSPFCQGKVSLLMDLMLLGRGRGEMLTSIKADEPGGTSLSCSEAATGMATRLPGILKHFNTLHWKCLDWPTWSA